MDDIWIKRFQLIELFAKLALGGLALMLLRVVEMTSWLSTVLIVVGTLFCCPLLIYAYVVVIWHWKARYRGKHSDLWGALILIETSGWMKVVYFFRHIVPDMRRSGRYQPTTSPEVLEANGGPEQNTLPQG